MNLWYNLHVTYLLAYGPYLVQLPPQTLVHSAELGVRAGVDDSLRSDGRGGGIGVAVEGECARRQEEGACRVRGAACAEPCVDAAVLWPAPSRPGVRGHRVALARDRGDHRFILPRAPRGRVAACAIPCVGLVCSRFERGVPLVRNPGRTLRVGSDHFTDVSKMVFVTMYSKR